MSRPENLLQPKSTEGWETSVSGKELVDIFPSEFSKPSFKTISLKVKDACQIQLIMGSPEHTHIIHLLEETGLEIDERFERVYSFKFLTDGVEFYALYSY